MAGPKKTHLKFPGTLFSLLLFGLAVVALLSSGIPERLGLPAIWERAYFHLGNVAVSPELLVETFVFLILLAVLTRFSRQFLRNEVLKHTALDQGQQYAIERTFGYAGFALGRLKSHLYFEIVRQFALRAISIPFPQRDVYIKSIPEFRQAAVSGAKLTNLPMANE